MHHYAMVNTLYIVTHCNSKKQSDIFTYAKYKYLITLLIKSHLVLLRLLDKAMLHSSFHNWPYSADMRGLQVQIILTKYHMYKEISVSYAKRSSKIKCIFKQYCGKLNLSCTHNLGPWMSR